MIFSPKAIAFIMMIASLIGNLGCQEKEVNNCRDGTCTFLYYENSTIALQTEQDLNSNLEITAGDAIVFEYVYVYNDERNIADDELTEKFYFQIPGDVDEFEINLATYLLHNVYFSRFCFCPFVGYKQPSEGTIQCRKLKNDQWEVTIDVSIDYYEGSDPYRLDFKSSFNKN